MLTGRIIPELGGYLKTLNNTPILTYLRKILNNTPIRTYLRKILNNTLNEGIILPDSAETLNLSILTQHILQEKFIESSGMVVRG
jgi:hypothetical protein